MADDATIDWPKRPDRIPSGHRLDSRAGHGSHAPAVLEARTDGQPVGGLALMRPAPDRRLVVLPDGLSLNGGTVGFTHPVLLFPSCCPRCDLRVERPFLIESYT